MWPNKSNSCQHYFFKELQWTAEQSTRRNLFFTLGSIARLELVGELFQNICCITIHPGYINMPSNGIVPDNSNKTLLPPPSVVLNSNCVLNRFMSFYDIQMLELLPNPIKTKHLWWLGNRCILKVPRWF